MGGRLPFTLAATLVSLAVIAFALDVLPVPITVALLALFLAFVPGAALVAWLRPGGDRRLTIALALALSPFVAGACAALLIALGLAPSLAARIVIAAVLVAWLFAPKAPPSRTTDPGTWMIAGAWTALIAILLTANPALLARADGWFHAAVSLQIAGRGLPPEDPFFAGLRLLYFWGAHAWSAVWLGLAPRVPVWAPLACLSLAAAFACPLAVGVLAERLGGGPREQRWAAGLLIAGLAPFAWLLIPARIAIGGVQGGAEVTQLLERGLWPVLAAMDPGTLHASVLFFADKFLIASPFAIGIALAVLFAITLAEVAARPTLRGALMLAMLEAATLWLHAVVGAATLVLAAGWWLASLPRAENRRALMLVAAAMLLAGSLLLPYLAGITTGKRQTIGWGFGGAALRTWLLVGAAVVPAGMAWLIRAARGSYPARDLLAMLVALTLAALLAGLPLGNQSKLLALLFALLAAPAAIGWSRFATRLGPAVRRAVVAGLVIALVPTQLFGLYGAATEHGQLRLAWDRPASADEREGWRWASRNTREDALFVDGSGGLDFTVLAARSAVWGGEAWAGNWGYPESALATRRRAAATLGRGQEPPAEIANMLRDLHRPVVVVARRLADPDGAWQHLVAAPGPGSARVTPLYRNRDLALFAWRPQ